MKLSDKIGLWADAKLAGLYWSKHPLKSLQEKFCNALIPVCGHKDFETGEECKHRGEPCWLPNYMEDGQDDEVVWYCDEHIQTEGFCRGCRQLWAGCEDFDFDPHGLCSNCRHDPDYNDDFDDDYGDEDWQEDYNGEFLP